MRSLSIALMLLVCAQSAWADPAGQKAVQEVLSSNAEGDVVTILAALAKQGDLQADAADLFRAAFRAQDLAPATRRLLSNVRSVQVKDGVLELQADRPFQVPAPGNGTFYLGSKVRVSPSEEGKVALEGVEVGPRRGLTRHNAQKAWIDPDGVYGFDLGKPGEASRPIQLRAQVEEEAPAPVEPAPEVPRPEPVKPTPAKPAEPEPVKPATPPARPADRPAPVSGPAQPYMTEELAPTQVGDQGKHVLALQKALQELGYSVPADRNLGPTTRSAVMELQRKAGLAPNGVVDAATIAAIRAQLEAKSGGATPGVDPSTDAAPVEPVEAASGATGQEGAKDALRDAFGLPRVDPDATPFVPAQRGDRGTKVRELQERLNQNGASLTPDGQFGPATTEAIRRFQESKGLPVTGEFDEATNRALGQSTPKTLRRGARGQDVTDLQQALRARGAKIGTDGQFGGATESALRDFQRRNGLDPTGVADEDTWKLLDSFGRGDRGAEVRELQENLNRRRRARGAEPIKVDGQFGPSTEAALKELQRASGLPETGRADRGLRETLRRQAAATSAAGNPVLQKGDRSPAVEELQQQINKHREAAGLPKIPEDGMFGSSTETALETFQRGTGLGETGVTDPKTWDALGQTPAEDVRASALREGDKHPEVEILQRQLNRHREMAGLDRIDEDGRFGPKTRKALEDFQRSQGLPITGRTDADTNGKLSKEPEPFVADSGASRPSTGAGSIPASMNGNPRSAGASASRPATQTNSGSTGETTDPGSGSTPEDSTPGSGINPTPGSGLRGLKIALDVGHGRTHRSAFDPGAVNNQTNVTEYELNRLTGIALKAHLEAQGAQVSLFVYPRNSSSRLSLFRKGARASGHDIFVSLHHNASQSHRAQGAEVLYHASKGGKEAKDLAQAIQRKLAPALGISNRGTKGQALGVLSGSHGRGVKASVLVEGFFIDPPNITMSRGQAMTRKEAKAISDGIVEYAKTLQQK